MLPRSHAANTTQRATPPSPVLAHHLVPPQCPLDNCLICENLTGNCTMCQVRVCVAPSVRALRPACQCRHPRSPLLGPPLLQVGMGLVNGKCEACSDDE